MAEGSDLPERRQFKRGGPKRPAEARFWEKVDKAGPVPDNRPDLGPCWIWLAGLVEGYGAFHDEKPIVAHRWAWQNLIGPIPDGLQLDHLCRVHRCVNPAHLEPVTQRENLLRGETVAARHANADECPNGHPYTEDNTLHIKGHRRCRECWTAYNARNLARQRARYHARRNQAR